MSDIFNKAIPIASTPMNEYEHSKELQNREAEKRLNRQLGAKKSWEKRRAKQVVDNTPKPPDRHRIDQMFTMEETIALANLIVDYPFLRKLL